VWYSEAGRPRSSPRRFAANVGGCADIGRFGFADAFSAPVVGLRRRNRPAVGYPPYVCRHVLAFSSNLFGSITHRGGRDARVPVRAASRQLLSAAPTLGVLVLPVEISTHFTHLWDEGKPRPYNVNVFWFWAIEMPVRAGDPVVGCRRRNRLAVGCPPYVGYLTLATLRWLHYVGYIMLPTLRC
jgi:hypothetical protein